MGLDTQAVTPVVGSDEIPDMPGYEFAPDPPFAGIKLVGCDGQHSFRGAAYEGLLRVATGRDPYDNHDPAAVADMAARLDTFDLETAIAAYPEAEWWRDEDTIGNLRRFFRVCADHGYGLRAGY